MKVTELIERLQRTVEVSGDLDIHISSKSSDTNEVHLLVSHEYLGNLCRKCLELSNYEHYPKQS